MEDYYLESEEPKSEEPESEEEEEEEEEFLFPRNLDFGEVCSCHECCAKTSELKDFEKELLSKLEQVEGYMSQFNRSKERCFRFPDNIEQIVILYDLLHHNLKQVHENLGGLSSTFERRKCEWLNRLKDVYMSMIEMVFGEDKDGNMNTEIMQEDTSIYTIRYNTIPKTIDHLLELYKRCRITDEAHELIKKILDIENQHERDKKSDIALDPSISKMYIENQIELLKELPFEEVEREMKEIFDQMSPCEENKDMLIVVREGIFSTRRDMFHTSSKFWQKYLKINCKGKGHGLSGLEITLDSLTNEMELFNDMWKNDYVSSIAHIISLCQQAEAQGFCPQGLCPPCCLYH